MQSVASVMTAVFLMVPAFALLSTVTFSVSVLLSPLARESIVQVTVPSLFVPSLSALTNSKSSSSVSDTFTPVRSLPVPLVTLMV